MLRLEHVNLAVSDIGNSLKFYQAAMPHWQVRGEGIGGWSGTPRRWTGPLWTGGFPFGGGYPASGAGRIYAQRPGQPGVAPSQYLF